MACARPLLAALLLAGASTTHAQPARAAGGSSEPPPGPPLDAHAFQCGVAPVAEVVADPGDVCPGQAVIPCIIGGGGGLALRAGYHTRSPWYVGGAYQLTRHDSSNLLRLAILQQLRLDLRYYLTRGQRTTPYLLGGPGVALYGNEFGTETGALLGGLGAGVEFEVSRTAVIGAATTYRPMLFRGWTDSSGARRADRYFGFGLAHFIGLEVVLEMKDPLPRW